MFQISVARESKLVYKTWYHLVTDALFKAANQKYPTAIENIICTTRQIDLRNLPHAQVQSVTIIITIEIGRCKVLRSLFFISSPTF